MIPFRSIFDTASKSPAVKKVAVWVLVLALGMYASKLVFGSNIVVGTESSGRCAIDLADRSARLDLTEKALASSERVAELCIGARP